MTVAVGNRGWWLGAAVAAAAAGAWMLRDTGPSAPGSAVTGAPQAGVVNPPASQAAASAASDAAAAITARFKLTGLMSGVGESRAFISVDGQPARPVRVGEVVEGDWVLREVAARSVVLGPRDGGPGVMLDLPKEMNTAGAPAGPVRAAPLAERTVQAQENLRKIGARHAPLRPASAAEAQKPPAAPTPPTAPVDDGRWRPAGS
ncbi:MAG: hypothetical protein JNM33_01320 [Rubrivivax sp.]|nr:hypothetical protein [Rubrivivax sp.]